METLARLVFVGLVSLVPLAFIAAAILAFAIVLGE